MAPKWFDHWTTWAGLPTEYRGLSVCHTSEPCKNSWTDWVKLSDEDIADFEVLRHVAMATVFGFLYMGCTLAPPGEYNWTAHVRRRCGLMSNYFDHLLQLGERLQHPSSVNQLLDKERIRSTGWLIPVLVLEDPFSALMLLVQWKYSNYPFLETRPDLE